MNQSGAVLVFGASGYTGALTVAELARQGIPVELGGRERVRLEALRDEFGLDKNTRITVADPTRPETLAALFDSKPAMIINCVGPFTKYGEAVVAAAIAARTHYLDITGEQGYMLRIIDRYHVHAQQKGVVIVPACGVEFALGNWLATLSAEGLEPLENIFVANAINTGGKGISAGTTLSLFEALKKPGIGWKEGRRQVTMVGSEGRRITFPDPIGERRAILAPFGEVLTLPRHLQVRNVKTYFAVGNGSYWLTRLTFPLLPVLVEVAGFFLKRAVKRGGPKAEKRESTEWAIVAEASNATRTRRHSLSGKDVYGLTAVLLAYCANALLKPEFATRNLSGVLDPAQVFDSRAAITFLQSRGVRLE
jgi:short subunit dehydrogenase-like uncharacterized protein